MHDLDQQRDALQSDLDAKAEAEAGLNNHLSQLEQHMQHATRWPPLFPEALPIGSVTSPRQRQLFSRRSHAHIADM